MYSSYSYHSRTYLVYTNCSPKIWSRVKPEAQYTELKNWGSHFMRRVWRGRPPIFSLGDLNQCPNNKELIPPKIMALLPKYSLNLRHSTTRYGPGIALGFIYFKSEVAVELISPTKNVCHNYMINPFRSDRSIASDSLYVCIYIYTYGRFLKWWYPQNTPKWSFLVGKPHGCWVPSF